MRVRRPPKASGRGVARGTTDRAVLTEWPRDGSRVRMAREKLFAKRGEGHRLIVGLEGDDGQGIRIGLLVRLEGFEPPTLCSEGNQLELPVFDPILNLRRP